MAAGMLATLLGMMPPSGGAGAGAPAAKPASSARGKMTSSVREKAPKAGKKQPQKDGLGAYAKSMSKRMA